MLLQATEKVRLEKGEPTRFDRYPPTRSIGDVRYWRSISCYPPTPLIGDVRYWQIVCCYPYALARRYPIPAQHVHAIASRARYAVPCTTIAYADISAYEISA
eukprot:3941318-Rhodomonas_salina.1